MLQRLTLLVFVCTGLLLASCRKSIQLPDGSSKELHQLKQILQDSLSIDPYHSLDWTGAVRVTYPTDQFRFYRLPFQGKSISTDFVILKIMNEDGKVEGRIVRLEETGQPDRYAYRSSFNGRIHLRWLNGRELLSSEIREGYVTAFHPSRQIYSKAPVTPSPEYIEMPEVIIVCSPSYNRDSYDLGVWISMMKLMGGGGGGGNSSGGSGGSNYSGWYSGGEGGGGSNTPGSSHPPGSSSPVSGPIVEEPAIKVDFENQDDDPAIDLEKYLKCFTDMPDAGATGSIELFADVPVDSDPTKLFDWNEGSPGHVFIQLRKKSGTREISQNIGFYPASGLKTATTPAPVKGKFVDNKQHEFNVSIKINLTATQLNNAIIKIKSLKNAPYDIDDYNCTDWAILVFNATVRPEQMLTIPKTDIPGGMAPYGTSTPQGLYEKLQQMQRAGGPAAAGITIPIVGWVGKSSGPCQ